MYSFILQHLIKRSGETSQISMLGEKNQTCMVLPSHHLLEIQLIECFLFSATWWETRALIFLTTTLSLHKLQGGVQEMIAIQILMDPDIDGIIQVIFLSLLTELRKRCDSYGMPFSFHYSITHEWSRVKSKGNMNSFSVCRNL